MKQKYWVIRKRMVQETIHQIISTLLILHQYSKVNFYCYFILFLNETNITIFSSNLISTLPKLWMDWAQILSNILHEIIDYLRLNFETRLCKFFWKLPKVENIYLLFKELLYWLSLIYGNSSWIQSKGDSSPRLLKPGVFATHPRTWSLILIKCSD